MAADAFGHARGGLVTVIIPPSSLKRAHLPEMLKKPWNLKSCLLFSGFWLFSLWGDASCQGFQEAEGQQHGGQTVPAPRLKQVTSVVSLEVLLSPLADSKLYYIPVA